MALLGEVVNFIFHIDVHLGEIILRYGWLSYAIIFFIIFCETGFVFTPFLPGDYLLFAAGSFAAIGFFNLLTLLFIFWLAASLGDTVNYWIGYFLGQKIIDNPKIPFINQEHIDKTQKFYEKHGGKTIFLARFIPIIRTFAPFVAGVGKMNYRRFIVFNLSGGGVWTFTFINLGYFFGNIPEVKKNFSFVILAIIFISFLPILIGTLRKN